MWSCFAMVERKGGWLKGIGGMVMAEMVWCGVVWQRRRIARQALWGAVGGRYGAEGKKGKGRKGRNGREREGGDVCVWVNTVSKG